MTIPGVDILGSKKGYSQEKPWLFEDFDQITFYRVSEEEYERQLALFNSGRYEYEWEEVVFDMAEHNKLLRETRDEVDAIRARQRKAQAEMERLEAELLARWEKEKAANSVSVDTIEALLQGESQTDVLSQSKAKKKKKLMPSIDHRPRNHPHRSPSQRQRMESSNPGRRSDRQRSGRRHSRSHETGDCRADRGTRQQRRGGKGPCQAE
ncbi:hypothetical protein VTN96DRAFT_10465 [Rasamsonia emersonii]